MIRTTGFKRAFLMPSNRRLSSLSILPGQVIPGSRTSHGWLINVRRRNGFPYFISSYHAFTNPVFDRMIPSQPRYAVKPETFKRLFQPNLSHKGPYRLFYQK